MSDADDPAVAWQTGLDLQRAGRWADAVQVYRGLLDRRLTVNLVSALGLCLMELGELAEAEHWLRLAVTHQPDRPETRLWLAGVYAETGRVEASEAEYRAALSLDPESLQAKLGLAWLLLSVGRYREGWPLMEARVLAHPDTVPPVNVPFPEWRGEPLAGKSILVWYEQGQGDQIQMCRFAQSLKAMGASRVSLGCRPQLVDLLATAPGVDAVIAAPMGGEARVGPHDYWSRYFSVPAALGVTLESLPTAPYLAALPERLAKWRGYGGVGLAWKANATGFNVANKSLSDEDAQVLLDMGCTSLLPEHTGVTDFADTAAIIAQLDLVISIDTSVAHLAGALGKPCWTMLPRLRTDWRWLRDRSDSPWYPTMTLYRQQAAGDWTGVVSQVAADLTAFRSR